MADRDAGGLSSAAMSDSSSDSQPQESCAAQDNLFDLFRAMARSLPDAEIVESPSLSRHHSFPTNPMFKGVWGTRLSDDEAEDAIDDTLAWFVDRGAPYIFWWTGPGTQPADLPERLRRRGFLDMAEQQATLAAGIHQTVAGAPCMEAPLSDLDESLISAVPDGFEIRRATHVNDMHDFKSVFVESYQIPDWAGQAWLDATVAAGLDRSPWQVHIGYLNGRPVATNMVLPVGDVVGAYAVATVPDARGKGIGSAVTLAPLLEARAHGCRTAALFSTEMGLSMYKRMGFRVVPGTINRFLWRA